jgi:hypothetical protein
MVSDREREIEGIRKQPEAYRALAQSLLDQDDGSLPESAIDFLDSQLRRTYLHEYSHEQGRVLLEIQDEQKPVKAFRDGTSVRILLKTCWHHKAYVDDPEDSAWIKRTFERAQDWVRGCEESRLRRIARNATGDIAA